MMRAKVYCGCYKTFTESFYDMDNPSNECCYESIVELDEEDWEDGSASIICPSCGNTLTQDMAHFEQIEEDTDQ